MNICIFGDSIVYGSYDSEKGGWANRMKLNLEKEDHEKIVYNLGISGDTTKWLLERFEFELEQRIDDEEKTVVIFSIGINDSVWLIKERRNNVLLSGFEKNIERLISKAGKFTEDIIFLGLMPVEKKKTSPVSWATNFIYNNIYIERYNSKLKEICAKRKVAFIDLYSQAIKIDYKKLLDDGLHPNPKGHKWIAERVVKFLDEA